MGYTLTEKLLLAHTKNKTISPGEFIYASVDLALANDITAPIAIKVLKENNIDKVFAADKIALVLDHFTPNKDIQSAEQCKLVAAFAKEKKIVHFFSPTGGNAGIEHILLPERGLVLPGYLVIGADSHTCTYGALTAFSTGVGSTDLAFVLAEGKIWLRVPKTIKVIFHGKRKKYVFGKDLILYLIGKIGVDGANYKSLEFYDKVTPPLCMEERFTICNMVIECGAKNGLFPYDEITERFVKLHSKKKYKVYHSDKNAVYEDVIEIDVGGVSPQVALPPLPSNSVSVDELKEKIYIDQVVIGSCTNGWLYDLKIAARILVGRKIHPNVRLIVIPATQEIYKQALKEGIIEVFTNAGGIISPPTCGPCLGGHMGILADGERCLATTNRNFVGRMGSTKSEVYLSSPAVAAASAVAGYIVSPEEIRK